MQDAKVPKDTLHFWNLSTVTTKLSTGLVKSIFLTANPKTLMHQDSQQQKRKKHLRFLVSALFLWCPGTESNRRHEDFQYWFHGFCLILKSSYLIVILIFSGRSGCNCILAVSAFLCNFPSTFTQELHRDYARHAAYCGRSAEYLLAIKETRPNPFNGAATI